MANTKPNKLEDFPVLIPDENIKIINDMKFAMENSPYDMIRKINSK